MFKKLLACCLAVTMCFNIGITAFADETTETNIVSESENIESCDVNESEDIESDAVSSSETDSEPITEEETAFSAPIAEEGTALSEPIAEEETALSEPIDTGNMNAISEAETSEQETETEEISNTESESQENEGSIEPAAKSEASEPERESSTELTTEIEVSEPEKAGESEILKEDSAITENSDSEETCDEINVLSSSHSGTCGGNLTWTLNDGVLTISGTGGMNSYSYDYTSDFQIYKTAITSVIISGNVTSIGDIAFYGFSNLTSVSIPNSVTSIGRGAFQDCSKLKSIKIPDHVTQIKADAFNGCSSLTAINIPNGITNICSCTFANCSSLKSITIPNGVTEIEDCAFESCSSLKSITIPDGVTNISDYAFAYCSHLTSITIPNSVTRIGMSAFLSCSRLTGITIPNGVTMIYEGTFQDCSSLKKVSIPNSVRYIGVYAFIRCTALKSITIPKSIDQIDLLAFEGCTNLTITYNGNDCGWTKLGYSFDRVIMKDKSSHSLRGSVTKAGTESAKGKYTYACSKCGKGYTLEYYADQKHASIAGVTFNGVYDCVIPSSINGCSVTAICSDAFKNCSELTGIKIPNSVTDIGNNALLNCSSLTGITIPNTVTSIGKHAVGMIFSKVSNTYKPVDGFILKCGKCTAAYHYAVKNGISYSITLKTGNKHTIVTDKAAAATCTTAGKTAGKHCSVCGKVLTAQKAVAAKGHKIVIDKAVAATYKSAGKTAGKHCSVCSTVFKAQKAIARKTLEQTTVILSKIGKSIKIYWNEITGAEGYYIYRDSKLIRTIRSGSTVSFVDTASKTNGQKYTYKVIAFAGSNQSKATTGISTYYFSKPVISGITNRTSRTIKITWDRNSKAAGYEVKIVIGTKSKVYTIKQNSTVTLSIDKLSKGKIYMVAVRAFKKKAGKCYYSSWSDARLIKIK